MIAGALGFAIGRSHEDDFWTRSSHKAVSIHIPTSLRLRYVHGYGGPEEIGITGVVPAN